MVNLKSRGCRKLKRGSIVIIRRPHVFYSEPFCRILYGRMRFDDVCLFLMCVEVNVIDQDRAHVYISPGEHCTRILVVPMNTKAPCP